MDRVFGGVRAPSTLGSFLRAFTWGNVSQLQKAHRELLAALSREAPLLPGAEALAFVDIDSTQKRVHGYKKQGARFGHTKIAGKSLLVKGLNVLAGVISTPLSAPVIVAARLRGGNAASARGAASLVKEAIATARACGCAGTIIVRMDSGFYSAAMISAIRAAGARFSVTAPMNDGTVARPPSRHSRPARHARARPARVGRPHSQETAQDAHRLPALPRGHPRKPCHARGVIAGEPSALKGGGAVLR